MMGRYIALFFFLLFVSSCSQLLSKRNIASDENFIEKDKQVKNLFVEAEEFSRDAFLLYREIMAQNLTYIHSRYTAELDQTAVDLIALEKKIDKLADDLSENETNIVVLESIRYIRLKMSIFLRSRFLSTFDQSYMTARFFNEGSLERLYPQYFYKEELKRLKIDIDDLKRFADLEEKLEHQDLLKNLSDGELRLLTSIAEVSHSIDIPSKKDLRLMRKQNDSWFEEFGNKVGAAFVNFLGQVMKKRKHVLFLRLESNFRENYLFEKREAIIKALFEGGMEPGDIILEKDLQANSDLIIPGYFVHASAYLGTIKDFKRLGLWNDPQFSKIQKDIEDYRSVQKKIRFLQDELKNRYAFEDIPWFIESDRPGVGVHPLMKFLQTDGMVVLRPTRHWNEQAAADIFKTFNKYVGLPYDYVHNVKNRDSVTCSKLILHVYKDITFPTSKNLNYISVSPDQIASPVSSTPESHDGQLEVLMFFDAYNKGDLVYSWKDRNSYMNYQKYIQVLPEGVFLGH